MVSRSTRSFSSTLSVVPCTTTWAGGSVAAFAATPANANARADANARAIGELILTHNADGLQDHLCEGAH